jgi:NADPH:quinone reductase-like Zn-dependent oxidoreductase
VRAVVVERPGPPEVLTLREVPLPDVRPGWVVVQVRAFGLNRSEMFTRQGHSPGVRFPRVLGIECVGVVADPGDSGLAPGTMVAAVMGGMGRDHDGGYAEYALLPADRLMPLTTTLDWPTLGALPETFLTASGSLDVMAAVAGQRLLIRGATSSVGMAALSLAAARGLQVAATTRTESKAAALRRRGADRVIVDDGDLPAAVRAVWPDGADAVLDLVGGPAVVESLRVTRRGGVVCNTGILGGAWIIPGFEPLEDIPSGVKLTTFVSSTVTAAEGGPALQRIADDVAGGRYDANVDRVFTLDEIVDAHRYMEGNRATGKLVVVV